MAKSRESLQYILERVLGSRHVYFQPPESVKMVYPAIVYSVNHIENLFADGSVYTQNIEYEVIVIDKDPDSEIARKVLTLPLCRFNRVYQSENLNHYVYTLYF